ncbi:protein MCM10 homolog [Centruroides vittatus]|uniref:protein MCM10 homolog n=1 Tax=Centruroides vittatus TaxID=120091 RepID=UPI00350FB7D3
MEELDLDVVTQLLETDEDNWEDKKDNLIPDNEEMKHNEEKSEQEIKNELELVKKRMDELQKQLQKKALQENAEKTVNELSEDKRQITELTKGNKMKDIGIDIFISQSKSVLDNKVTDDKAKSEIHLGEIDSSDDEMNAFGKSSLSELGREIKRNLNQNSRSLITSKFQSKNTWTNSIKSRESTCLNAEKGASSKPEFEIYSNLRIINPLISSSVMKSRMEGRKLVKMSSIRLHMRGNDIEGDWVTVGVIVKKVPPNTSKKGNVYSIWKMNDLKNCEKFVNFFLFGEVHKQHWKTTVGMVVAFLNANIMTDRNKNSDEISFSVDHPGKVMMIGTSKDLGQCKSKRKDGASCQNIINLSQGEYCAYHVKQEYRKLSLKRTELQSSYSGTEPKCLRKTILNKQPIFYGGQSFVLNSKKTTNKKKEIKGQLKLDNFKLQKKAENLMHEEREKYLKIASTHSNSTENEAIKDIISHSSFMGEKLSIPSAGSRNFLRHLIKNGNNKVTNVGEIKSITPKELLKMHKRQLEETKQQIRNKNILTNSLNKPQHLDGLPCLGRNVNPGGFITLELTQQKTKVLSTEIAKLKAINIIQENGKISPSNPNEVKKKMSPDVQEKVKRRLNQTSTDSKENLNSEVKRSRLSDIDLNSNKIQEIINRKSSHAHEVEMEDLEKQDKYFNVLEKKEQMEEKMQSIMEITCDVISCKTCMYTSYQPSERCKTENHPLKRHKAIKRFFRCMDCNHRTFAFTKLPKKSCRKCGGSNFERTSMMKPKEGIKSSHKNLLIRGIEEKFL